MQNAKRVVVHNAAWCTQIACPHYEGKPCLDKFSVVDCRKRDCDNHQRGLTTLPSTLEPPFELPPFETPSSPE